MQCGNESVTKMAAEFCFKPYLIEIFFVSNGKLQQTGCRMTTLHTTACEVSHAAVTLQETR